MLLQYVQKFCSSLADTLASMAKVAILSRPETVKAESGAASLVVLGNGPSLRTLLEGDEMLLKPMILKDVAERTGLDISTISRVSNSKYVQTNYGIYPLKWFFSDGYTTEDGQEIATRKIQNALKEIIENEDKKKPLSDETLTQMLNQKGFPIARRTVAKYREQLGIPVARLRK